MRLSQTISLFHWRLAAKNKLLPAINWQVIFKALCLKHVQVLIRNSIGSMVTAQLYLPRCIFTECATGTPKASNCAGFLRPSLHGMWKTICRMKLSIRFFLSAGTTQSYFNATLNLRRAGLGLIDYVAMIFTHR